MKSFMSSRFLPLFLLCSPVLNAQIVPIVSKVTTGEAAEGKPLAVTVELSQNVGVTRVLFVHRSFGQSEFKELEMQMAGRNASITLPGSAVKAPYVEYYVRVELVGNRLETYPVQNPDTNPIKISIKEPDPKDLEVVVLSPEPGETVASEELGLAVSFFYASDAIDIKATKLYLDGIDVSAEAVLSEDILLYSPQNFPRPLELGSHAVKVELFDTTGKPYHSIQSSFNLSTTSAIQEAQTKFLGRVDGQLELRNESLSSGSTFFARGDVRASGNYGWLNVGGLAHLDNQDKPELQPQNRFSIFAETPYLRLEYGDAYPRFPSMLASGKRVRGLTGNLTLGFFNLDVSIGQTARRVDGKDTLVAPIDTGSTSVPNNTYLVRDTTYAYFIPGTYTRKFLAIRPSFGSGESFQLGLNFMKAKDDVASIKRGVLPQENLVTGLDLLVAFDDQRFKWETQGMLSLTNTDISEGSFTDADYDQFAQSDKETADELKRIGNIASKIITVNENLYPSNPVGQGLPSVAFESAVTINYFNNYLSGSFFHRGASYKSFGNDFLQTDIRGFFVSDRIRMFENRAFLSVSYESKHDNTADTKEGTTDYRNMNTSLTVNPRDFPSLTFGYGFNNRVADYNIFDPDSSQTSKFADENTNRFFFGTSYDFLMSNLRQTASFSLSIANKKDKTFYKADQKNLYVQLSWSTEFKIPLITTLGYSLSSNENDLQTFKASGADSILSVNEFNYSALQFSAQYRMLEDKLRLAAAFNPIFGSINRLNFLAGATYAVSEHHNVDFFLNFIQNSAQADDFIVSMIYRFNF